MDPKGRENGVDLKQRERRSLLLEEMQRVASKGIDCAHCEGTCCTFAANSMRVTPLETYDLWFFLEKSHRWNEATRQLLLATIDRFRLDHPVPGNGRRSYGRRTYTCPFFNNQIEGCSIDLVHKPYGCLGFNPKIAGQTSGGKCGHQLGSELRDVAALEETANIQLREILEFDEQTKTIPEALLTVWGKETELKTFQLSTLLESTVQS